MIRGYAGCLLRLYLDGVVPEDLVMANRNRNGNDLGAGKLGRFCLLSRMRS